MKERLSNVLAWLGFGITALTILNSIMDGRIDSSIWFALGVQGFLGTINYLMSGSFRLLPWLGVGPSDTEE